MREKFISIGAVAIFFLLFLIASEPPRVLLAVFDLFPEWWPIAALGLLGLGIILFLKKSIDEHEKK